MSRRVIAGKSFGIEFVVTRMQALRDGSVVFPRNLVARRVFSGARRRHAARASRDAHQGLTYPVVATHKKKKIP